MRVREMMERAAVLTLLFSFAFGQDKPQLIAAFHSAAAEFSVPADILKGIAFAETRWQHLEWAEGDTANCMAMPHAYGVMSLRDDSWFGHSLHDAAELIGQTTSVLKRDYAQNIRGAAALLKKLHDELPVPDGTSRNDVESWQPAVAAYCGIPQKELAYQHALEIFLRFEKGYKEHGILLNKRTVNLQPLKKQMTEVLNESVRNQRESLEKKTSPPDYPGAKWAQAYPGHWYSSGYQRDFVVIHDMEGYYLSTISYFQLMSTSASIYYDINGLQDTPSDMPAGDITQQVEEQYWAWHVRCWNTHMFGIEHEGFVSNPVWYTPEMYVASAKLTKYFCEKYNIPKDRNHIIGHNEWQNSSWVSWFNNVYKPANSSDAGFTATCNDHTDPGQFWDWAFYMQLVKQDSAAPRVTSAPPSGKLQAFDKVSVTFDQRMEPNSIQQNFKISPNISGSLSWTTDYRTVSFVPTAYLSFNTTYTVTIDTGTHNYLNIGLDQNSDGITKDLYQFTFQTVESDTIAPQLVSFYPQDGQNGISLSVEPVVQFNEPLDPATLSGAFELKENSGSVVPISTVSSTSGFGFTRAQFRPLNELKPLSIYQLTISQQAKDFGGNGLNSARTVAFTTGPSYSLDGTVIDALDVLGGWWQPSTSGSTALVLASFSIVTDTKKAGNGSGKLAYSFTQSSGGYVREHNSSTPSIEGGSLVGAWVYGDNSGNNVEYWFYYPAGVGYIVLNTGPINWTGWKLVTISTSSVPVGVGTGRRFASFGVKQIAGALTSGTIYFDQLTLGNSVTGIDPLSVLTVPTEFRLHQNYPNPFNPSTMISFDVPRQGRIRISVFDMLGREIATLSDQQYLPGTYRIEWNASSLSSGVYFYKLESEGFIEARKMLLVR